jgi:hypothetical protein
VATRHVKAWVSSRESGGVSFPRNSWSICCSARAVASRTQAGIAGNGQGLWLGSLHEATSVAHSSFVLQVCGDGLDVGVGEGAAISTFLGSEGSGVRTAARIGDDVASPARARARDRSVA